MARLTDEQIHHFLRAAARDIGVSICQHPFDTDSPAFSMGSEVLETATLLPSNDICLERMQIIHKSTHISLISVRPSIERLPKASNHQHSRKPDSFDRKVPQNRAIYQSNIIPLWFYLYRYIVENINTVVWLGQFEFTSCSLHGIQLDT